MRLFIAILFSDEIKSRLLQIQNLIKTQASRGNFSRPENLHLTLVFIGETPPDQVPVISSVIDKALHHPFTEFQIDFNRTGFYKHSNKELWWFGADENDSNLHTLIELHQRLAAGLDAAGIKFDKRPFNAHITLGREIRHFAPITLPEDKITIPVRRISLMKSENQQGRLVYTELAGWGKALKN